MRKCLLCLLLASSAVPAVAADERDDRRALREATRAERAERAEAGEERPERQPPSRRSIQSRPVERSGGDAAPRAVERRPIERGPGLRSVRPALEPRMEPRIEPRMAEPPAERSPGVKMVRPTLEQRRGDSVREWRRGERDGPGAARPAVIERQSEGGWESLRERRREVTGRDGIGNRRAPIVSRVPREGTQPPAPAAARPSRLTTRHWRGDWRSDRRYDWRRHRDRHRSLFRFGFYYDPFGWGYRPYSVGWRMWPSYYRSSYWLNDPWRYRLPYAPPGYRWIRYYDDALLVDTWDGTVVDVIHNFFW